MLVGPLTFNVTAGVQVFGADLVLLQVQSFEHCSKLSIELLIRCVHSLSPVIGAASCDIDTTHSGLRGKNTHNKWFAL